MSSKSSTSDNQNSTMEQKSQAAIDWLTDAGYMLAPLLKPLLVAGMVYMNVQMGMALSSGDWVFPVMCGALDLSLLWFWNKSKSDELTPGERKQCGAWAMYLLVLSLLSGFVYACSLDAKNRIVTNPVVAEIKIQLESATRLFKGMETGTAEKAFGGDPVVSLREDYLKAFKKHAVDLGYSPIHAAFYVVPGVKDSPEFFMGIVRLLFVFGVMGSGLGIAHFGGGVGRARRINAPPQRTVTTKYDIVEGEFVPA